jgi:hypothetical protein
MEISTRQAGELAVALDGGIFLPPALGLRLSLDLLRCLGLLSLCLVFR